MTDGILRLIEKQIIEGLLWFFQLPSLIEVFTFAPLAVVLLIVQYQKQKDTVLPGILGLLSGYIFCLHYLWPNDTVGKLRLAQNFLNQPHQGVGKFPGQIELFFEKAIASSQFRYTYEECIVVALLLYLVSVLFHSVTTARKISGVKATPGFSFFGSKVSRPKRSRDNELGSGDFATTEQVAQWLRPTGKPADTILHVTDLRGDKGTIFKDGKVHIPREERNRHILAVAKTGSGKTTKLILPILYNDCIDPVRSTIVIDSKPEMWRKLAAMTKHYNPEKEIMLFNPLDKARSLSWNILSKIEDDTDAKLIANTIIMATDNKNAKGDTPFFRNNALAILNSIMVGLLHDPSERISMPRIHELVQSGMKPLCDWLEARPEAYRNTRTFVELARSGSQNADTIMSELGMRLNAWDLSTIRATTYFDELDLEKIISKPTLFIVELRESELEMLRPLANVLVIEILRYLTKRAEACPGTCLPRPVSLVIDEFASALGRLPDIHVKLNTLRSRNVSIVAAVQSLAQIKANYAEDADSVIAGFSTKIFMPTLDLSDAEWASKESGQMTIRFQTKTKGSNRKLIEVFASKNDSTQEQVQQRAVLTPDEIGRPSDNIATFFFPNTPVFQGFLLPFYKIPDMVKRITEFDSEKSELHLREKPIELEETAPPPTPGPSQGGGGGPNSPPPGITDSRGLPEEKIVDTLEATKRKLDWDGTEGSARKWWLAFENENKSRPALILRLAEELAIRKATITEFFLAYVYSNTDNIQANLHYLDYIRLKKEEEKATAVAEKTRQEDPVQIENEESPPTDRFAA